MNNSRLRREAVLRKIRLLEKGLRAEPHTPPYKIHRYFARRPWNVFNQLIKIFSNEQEIILDPFCGGGVTIYEGLRLNRKVVGFDINPLSTFIVENMVKKDINLATFRHDLQILITYLEGLYDRFERVDCTSEKKLLIESKRYIDWYELAHVIRCNYCGSKIVLSNENKISNGRYSCPNEVCKGNIRNNGCVEPKNCSRDGYQYLCSVTVTADNKKGTARKVEEHDLGRIQEHIEFLRKEIDKCKITIPRDAIPLDWDRQNEDLLYKKGIYNFQDLFTERNLLINHLLLNKIKSLHTDENTYEALRFVFSDSLRDTNIMAFTNENWQSGKPITWAKHAYWIPSQFCELNVIYAFQNSFKSLENALRFNKAQPYVLKKAVSFKEIKRDKNYYLVNGSIVDSDLSNDQVDAIITDPPYGSNVQYLELSQFWHVWNKDLYPGRLLDFLNEAVANRKKNFSGAKNYYDYENNLYKIFSKAFLVLKPNKYMVLTFNNRDVNAWLALLFSIFRAGFELEKGGLYFQEGIENYKQTAHTKAEGSPYGDFVYVFKKSLRCRAAKTWEDQDSLVKAINNSVEKNLKLYRENMKGRDEIKRRIFLEIMPKIESFAKANQNLKKRHNLYDLYKKDLFKDLYWRFSERE